jgi:signal transduction histidine kinase
LPSPDSKKHDFSLSRYLEMDRAASRGIGREVSARRNDGSTFPADLVVSEIPHLKLFTGILRDITRCKELEREVAEIASLQQQRIGQDPHDSVGQELTDLNLMVGDLPEVFRTDPQNVGDLIERMAEGLQRCQQQLRDVVQGFLPIAVDTQGLMSALADLADRTQRESKAVCTFICPKPVSISDNLTATHLFTHSPQNSTRSKAWLLRL